MGRGRSPHLDYQGLWLALELLVLQHLYRASLNNASPKKDLGGEVLRMKEDNSERFGALPEEQLA